MPPVPDANLGDSGDQAAVQLPNVPVPDLPALPKGATPPAAVIGVLGVPEIMRAATASQQVEKVIGERRAKLNEDAQKEQSAWRDLQQQLAAQRATLSPDQVRTKERDLQERITNAQKSFRDRNRIIQETAQYSLSQIERTLIGVIRQVAESRGMNLVLHRAQVALNINEFDITDQVTQQMNKVMPSVTIPPDGVSPLAQAQASPAATPASAASAPPTVTPAKR
jgi:Skp family chaperone for outer membrane proteins